MNESTESRVPWILWPFYAVWKLVTIILEILGRILCALFGIGLMATKKIIDAHKGMIAVKSKQNVGSEFIIRIPKLMKIED